MIRAVTLVLCFGGALALAPSLPTRRAALQRGAATVVGGLSLAPPPSWAAASGLVVEQASLSPFSKSQPFSLAFLPHQSE